MRLRFHVSSQQQTRAMFEPQESLYYQDLATANVNPVHIFLASFPYPLN